MRAGNITEVEGDWRWSPADEEEIDSSVCTHQTRCSSSHPHTYTHTDLHALVCMRSENTHISQLINFQRRQPRLLSCHTDTPYPCRGAIYMAQLYHTAYSITPTEEMLFFYLFLSFSFSPFTQTLMESQHTHCTTLYWGKAAFSIDLCVARL